MKTQSNSTERRPGHDANVESLLARLSPVLGEQPLARYRALGDQIARTGSQPNDLLARCQFLFDVAARAEELCEGESLWLSEPNQYTGDSDNLGDPIESIGYHTDFGFELATTFADAVAADCLAVRENPLTSYEQLEDAAAMCERVRRPVQALETRNAMIDLHAEDAWNYVKRARLVLDGARGVGIFKVTTLMGSGHEEDSITARPVTLPAGIPIAPTAFQEILNAYGQLTPSPVRFTHVNALGETADDRSRRLVRPDDWQRPEAPEPIEGLPRAEPKYADTPQYSRHPRVVEWVTSDVHRALGLSTDHQVMISCARILWCIDQLDECNEALTRALVAAPAHVQACIHIVKGEYRLAGEAFAADMSPTDEFQKPSDDLAALLQASGNVRTPTTHDHSPVDFWHTSARSHLYDSQRGDKLFAVKAGIRFAKAWCYEQAGDTHAAVAAYDDFVRNEPAMWARVHAVKHMALLLEVNAKPDEANDCFQSALRGDAEDDVLLALWMQYLAFCSRQQCVTKAARILSDVFAIRDQAATAAAIALAACLTSSAQLSDVLEFLRPLKGRITPAFLRWYGNTTEMMKPALGDMWYALEAAASETKNSALALALCEAMPNAQYFMGNNHWWEPKWLRILAHQWAQEYSSAHEAAVSLLNDTAEGFLFERGFLLLLAAWFAFESDDRGVAHRHLTEMLDWYTSSACATKPKTTPDTGDSIAAMTEDAIKVLQKASLQFFGFWLSCIFAADEIDKTTEESLRALDTALRSNAPGLGLDNSRHLPIVQEVARRYPDYNDTWRQVLERDGLDLLKARVRLIVVELLIETMLSAGKVKSPAVILPYLRLNRALHNDIQERIAETEQQLANARVEERNRVIADLSHHIKNLVSHVIVPLDGVIRRANAHLPGKTLEHALRGAILVREIVQAMSISFRGSADDFRADARANDEDATPMERLLVQALSTAVTDMFDTKYFSHFSRLYFPTRESFVTAKGDWEALQADGETHLDRITSFIDAHMLTIHIQKGQMARVKWADTHGSRVKFLILLNELLLNAMKYAAAVPRCSRNLSLSLTIREDMCVLTVANSHRPTGLSRTTGLGAVIIRNIAKTMGGECEATTQDERYSATVTFPNFWGGEE